MKLDGKAAFITGGGSGIGAETAKLFAGEGAAVAIVDTNAEAVEALAVELNTLGPTARGFTIDVTDETAVTSALAETFEAFGSLDIVVNSAIRMAPGKLIDLSTADWKQLIEVGLHATFVVGREAAKLMIRQGTGGSIINMSSNAGLAPYPGAGAYSTAKAGVIMLSKQQAIEWAEHGIRSNAICPGHVETPLTAYLQDPEIKAGREAVTPLGRIGRPDDIAEAALYLASDQSSWVTAEALVIDGGIVASIYNHLPGRKWSG